MTKAENDPAPRAGFTLGKIAIGAAWIIGARWALRLIGVISTIILARVLSPHDFGIVAMATLAIGLLQVFSETGQKLALIRMPRIERKHYDTAWTISVMVGFAIALGVVLAAPAAAAYFGEPSVEPLMYVLAAWPVLAGLENIGTVDFRRDMRFDSEFRLLVGSKLVSFSVTIALAFHLQSYWALIAGILSGQAAALVLSFLMHPYRPRPSLAAWRELFSFSAWSLASSLGAFMSEKADEFLVGRLYDAPKLGLYSVVGSVAAMPTDELIAPAARALYPAFARVQDDVTRFKKTYLDSFSALSTLAIASSVGTALVAKDAILVLLGERWISGSAIAPWLAFGAAILALSRTDNAALLALGKPRWVATRQWLFFFCLLAGLALGQWYAGLTGIAAARFGSVLVVYVVMLTALCRLLAISAPELLARLWRPLSAATIMSLSVGLFDTYIDSKYVRLATNVALGGTVFVSAQILLWALTGRPAGVEAMVTGRARAVLRGLLAGGVRGQ